MTDTEQTPVVQSAEEFLAERRNRDRRGCFIRLLGGWFGLMFLVIGFMVFIRSRVEDDPAKVMARVEQLVQITLPDNFQPHRRTAIFGNESIAFWDQTVLREDGRTTSLISLYREPSWRDRTLQDLEAEIESEMERLLARNEFHVRSKAVIPIEGGQIFRYVGVAQVEERREEAVSCFRMVNTPEGPVRFQTLGLMRDYDLAAQINTLQAIQPRAGASAD